MNFDSEWLLSLLEEAPKQDIVADALTNCGCLVELREPGDGAEIWDVEVTTNRPDAMNHRGLAREAAVATGTSLRSLQYELHEIDESTADQATIEIDDPDVCTRFAARIVRGVKQVPSPDWLQRRLSNCGVRPINAVVDVTNYVLLELGQPLHAYDLAKVRGNKLVARRAKDGELLTTLDGEDRKLDQSMAVIADSDGVVGLAGIMGGANSEISDDTVDVLLEAAHFDALTIRRAARRLGMHTEASHRFERGADPELPPVAVDLAAAMMAELAGGKVCRGRIDVHPKAKAEQQMSLSVKALSAFAGLDIAPARVVEIFAGLEFDPRLDGDTVTVTVPSFRIDIERVPDLYEEIIRHVGYSAIPSALPVLPATPGRRHPNWVLVDRARDAAIGAGLAEVMTWSFVDPGDDELVVTQDLCPGQALMLDNPLAQTQAVMRRSLLPGLLAAAAANLNQGEMALSIFEQGRVFNLSEDGPREHERLGIVLSMPSDDREECFVRLKGIVNDIMERVGLPAVSWRPGGAPWLHSSAGAELITDDDQVIGMAGLLSDEYRERWDLRATPMIAELDLDDSAEPPLPQFRQLARHPAVVVDMTVEHARDLAFADLEKSTLSLASDWVEDLRNVARFFPPKNPSVVRTTLRLVYRHDERSLTQDEVNTEQETLRRHLGEKLGVTFA